MPRPRLTALALVVWYLLLPLRGEAAESVAAIVNNLGLSFLQRSVQARCETLASPLGLWYARQFAEGTNADVPAEEQRRFTSVLRAAGVNVRFGSWASSTVDRRNPWASSEFGIVNDLPDWDVEDLRFSPSPFQRAIEEWTRPFAVDFGLSENSLTGDLGVYALTGKDTLIFASGITARFEVPPHLAGQAFDASQLPLYETGDVRGIHIDDARHRLSLYLFSGQRVPLRTFLSSLNAQKWKSVTGNFSPKKVFIDDVQFSRYEVNRINTVLSPSSTSIDYAASRQVAQFSSTTGQIKFAAVTQTAIYLPNSEVKSGALSHADDCSDSVNLHIIGPLVYMLEENETGTLIALGVHGI